jgi:hypothetical protein
VVVPERASKQTIENEIEKAKGRYIEKIGAEATHLSVSVDSGSKVGDTLCGLVIANCSATPGRHFYVYRKEEAPTANGSL